MEEENGEDDGRQGFDGSQETGFGGGDVFDAAEVTAKGYDGAENNDIGISDGGGIVPKAAELPRRAEGHQGKATKQHAPAGNQRGPPFANEAFGLSGVKGGGKGRAKAPE